MSDETFIIRKEKHEERFTIFDNGLLQDPRLSFRALGLACYLISLPDDWQIRMSHIASQRKEGIKSIRTAFRELAEYGYMMRERKSLGDRGIIVITRISELPVFAQVGTPETRFAGGNLPHSRNDPKGSDEKGSDEKGSDEKGGGILSTDYTKYLGDKEKKEKEPSSSSEFDVTLCSDDGKNDDDDDDSLSVSQFPNSEDGQAEKHPPQRAGLDDDKPQPPPSDMAEVIDCYTKHLGKPSKSAKEKTLPALVRDYDAAFAIRGIVYAAGKRDQLVEDGQQVHHVERWMDKVVRNESERIASGDNGNGSGRRLDLSGYVPNEWKQGRAVRVENEY